jgi:pimeloyl-ACP methyl ester carboxylesterase
MSKQTIVFIHGAWLTGQCWDNFKGYFEGKGYNCIAPNWPLDDRPISELRNSPDPALAKLGVSEIIDHYAAIISKLDAPPIIIGHSFGGLFTQVLMDRGLGVAGVAIDSAPPAGVLPTPAAIRGSLPVLLTWMGWQKILTISENNFRQFFANGMPTDQQTQVYKTQVIPTPGRIFFQDALALFHNRLNINFKNSTRGPLLMTAGGIDRTVPAAMNQVNYQKYAGSGAKTDFKVFPKQSHSLIMEPGWEEVAAYIENWLTAL